jgi:hypothetical protein
MKLLGLPLAFTALLAAALPAAELAPGLAYLRPDRAPPGELHAAGHRAVVLDLRACENPLSAAWIDALRGAAGPTQPLILALVSPETPAHVLQPLDGLPRCIRLGRDGSPTPPDVVVKIAPEADRAALDALARGTPPAELASQKISKTRHDETTLVRARDATPAENSEKDPADRSPAAEKPAVLDAVLQRAVQVYQGLLALGKV